MQLSLFLRNNLGNMPYPLGLIASKIPFSYRPGIGKLYRQRLKELKNYENCNIEDKKTFILNRVKDITAYSIENIPFYKDYYKTTNFNIDKLQKFDDIRRIPIIDKNILLQYPIEYRTNMNVPKFHANTGGSSGKTLNFYVQPSRMANEWAHLHYCWKQQMNFKYSDLKIIFDGRSNVKQYASYDFVRHSIRIDLYSDYQDIAKRLLTKYNKVVIRYLHGYPSAIYEFARFCENNDDLLNYIKNNLKGIILNSEFPFDKYRNKIEDIFQVKAYSFFGHTEGCIMAGETSHRNKYIPYQSYGFCEAIKFGNKEYLIGTNYYNHASPLIRYNTEDSVNNTEWENDILSVFSIEQGRDGDYIIDANGKKISLTGLIFGRHHELFNYSQHIQVFQEKNGFATILYSCKNEIDNPEKYFNTENINISFTFQQLKTPLKSISGKIKLKVNEL